MPKPHISVVIPTRGRPELVSRAVNSALNQTLTDIEVIVIVDGNDPATAVALSRISDVRLRVIELPRNVGVSEARNSGVRVALGEWIAFLDDDDEWLPGKLETQMAAARRSSVPLPILSCRVTARTPLADYVWPRTAPVANIPLSEYLFCRRSAFQGESYLATPTLVAPARLLRDVPFRKELRKHEDWDWLLRATSTPGCRVEFCPETLVICYIEENRTGLSNTNEWRFSLEWMRSIKDLITPQAFADFLLTIVTPQAVGHATAAELAGLAIEAFRAGRPSLWSLSAFLGFCIVPRDARRRLRAFLSKATICIATFSRTRTEHV